MFSKLELLVLLWLCAVKTKSSVLWSIWLGCIFENSTDAQEIKKLFESFREN